MMGYAAGTVVSEAKSRAEIEQTIRNHVGRDASYSYGTMAGRAAIQFSAYGRGIKFELPLPSREEAAKKAGRKNGRRAPPRDRSRSGSKRRIAAVGAACCSSSRPSSRPSR